MRIPGRKKLEASFRWGRGRFKDRALVLGYHRIASPDHDPFQLSVSPENFRLHLEKLCASCKPIRLSQLVAGLEGGEVEPGSVVLTFDDAYLETLLVAEPILAEFHCPATVFVTTSTLGQELWWDRLQRILFAQADRTEAMEIRVGSFEYHGPTAAEWKREELLMELYRELLVASEEDRGAALEQIGEWAGAGPASSPQSRVISREELLRLAEAPQIDIGSHTVSHPMLALLSREEQEAEIGPSREFLEGILGRSVPWFSYPNGSFNAISRELIRDAGFVGACGSQNDVVTTRSDPFRLPRFWPSNTPDALAGPLKLWLRP